MCRAARLVSSARSASGGPIRVADVEDGQAVAVGQPVVDERVQVSDSGLPARSVTRPSARRRRPPSSSAGGRRPQHEVERRLDLAALGVAVARSARCRAPSGGNARLEPDGNARSKSDAIAGTTRVGERGLCPSRRADRTRPRADRGRTSPRSRACSRGSGPSARGRRTCRAPSRRGRSTPTSDPRAETAAC